eukprot:351083-Chlamydomonas_euryale.AAC.10
MAWQRESSSRQGTVTNCMDLFKASETWLNRCICLKRLKRGSIAGRLRLQHSRSWIGIPTPPISARSAYDPHMHILPKALASSKALRQHSLSTPHAAPVARPCWR